MLDIIFDLIIGILGFSVGVVFLKNSNMDRKMKNKKG